MAWVLADIPASLLAWTGCPWPDRRPFCEHFSNTVGNIFGMFPMNLMLAFPSNAPFAVQFAVPAALTLVCAWLAWRFLPPRLGLGWFVLIAVGWFALGSLVLFGELFLPNYAIGHGRTA